jgi:hypothetical protein
MVIINKAYYAIPRHQNIKYTQEQKQIKTNRGHHRDKILRNVEKSVSDPQVLEDTIERDKILRKVCLGPTSVRGHHRERQDSPKCGEICLGPTSVTCMHRDVEFLEIKLKTKNITLWEKFQNRLEQS